MHALPPSPQVPCFFPAQASAPRARSACAPPGHPHILHKRDAQRIQAHPTLCTACPLSAGIQQRARYGRPHSAQLSIRSAHPAARTQQRTFGMWPHGPHAHLSPIMQPHLCACVHAHMHTHDHLHTRTQPHSHTHTHKHKHSPPCDEGHEVAQDDEGKDGGQREQQLVPVLPQDLGREVLLWEQEEHACVRA